MSVWKMLVSLMIEKSQSAQTVEVIYTLASQARKIADELSKKWVILRVAARRSMLFMNVSK